MLRLTKTLIVFVEFRYASIDIYLSKCSKLQITCVDDGQEKRNEDAPENNPQYTTVYVGNLAPEVSKCWASFSLTLSHGIIRLADARHMQVTSVDLHRHFHALGVGVIEDVRIQRDKGFGFIRYSSHAEAARAIQMGNARILFGKTVKVHVSSFCAYMYCACCFLSDTW